MTTNQSPADASRRNLDPAVAPTRCTPAALCKFQLTGEIAPVLTS